MVKPSFSLVYSDLAGGMGGTTKLQHAQVLLSNSLENEEKLIRKLRAIDQSIESDSLETCIQFIRELGVIHQRLRAMHQRS